MPEMLPGQFAEIRSDGSNTTFLRRPISINYVDKTTNEVWFLDVYKRQELKGVPVRLVMGGRDLENNTIEVMRRDTWEKETRSCDGIE